MSKNISIIITDLDNTLWDWVDLWYKSFRAMLNEIIRISNLDENLLIDEIRKIHQTHKTSEYAFLIEEIPSLIAKHPNKNLVKIYKKAIDAYGKERDKNLQLYPRVLSTLEQLKKQGVLIVGYTESMAFYTHYRIKKLKLDGVFDYIFSPADHDIPENIDLESIRHLEKDFYQLKFTKHLHTPKDEIKPNKNILLDIVKLIGAKPDQCIYIGDSLMKDISMAQSAKITDVHAHYGVANSGEKYELLKKVSHWTDSDIEKEKKSSKKSIKPSHVLNNCFSEILAIFNFSSFKTDSLKVSDKIFDIWTKTIDVQMHFNDIEMKIRSLALTLLSAFFVAVGYSIKENLYIVLFNSNIHLAKLLLLFAIITWSLFYLIDRFWYHRLLIGSVRHAILIEDKYKYILPELSLSNSIGKESPISIKNFKIHSTLKIDIIYLTISILLFILFLLSVNNLNYKQQNTNIENKNTNIENKKQ